jgi:prephenate dehydratase
VITLGQQPRVAFQGEHGAFSEDAAIKLLGPEIQLLPLPTFAVLFSSLAEGLADYALAPVENTLVGAIQPAVDLLEESELVVAGEVAIRVRQQLIGCPGTVLEEIESVESHPAALGQCKRFFAEHPRIKAIATEDTAGSVAAIMKGGDRKRAAIAGSRAAQIYGGCIVRENLEDDEENYTRFLLLRLSEPRAVATWPVMLNEQRQIVGTVSDPVATASGSDWSAINKLKEHKS